MSLVNSAAQGSSPTKTSTTEADEAARNPKDTGPIDAEFSEASPAPKPPPRVARVADVKPLDAGGVFGGPVNDTHNARAARGAQSDDAPKGKRGRKAKAPQEPAQEPTEKHLDTARGLVITADAFFRQHVRSRFEEALTEESLAQLDAKVKLQEGQIDALADPLARGLAEEGVELPWWAQLGLAGFGMYAGKLAMLSSLEKKVKENTPPKAEPAA